MHIEFLVEELSAKEALNNILPKILQEGMTFDIHDFSGKLNLITKLPNRLKGYKSWLPTDWRIVVLIDEDRQDCQDLKNKLERIASDAGLITKSQAHGTQEFQVINRIAIEELEAWFFGDVSAITQAYPGVSKNLASQAKYRDPDQINGGTWEALEKVLQRAGHHLGGLEKLKAAREISSYMDPYYNRSKSFAVFRDSLQEIGTVQH